ncbi:NgoMIV family type II restriction endonuclease [Sphingomonas crusticola]|uniref:NgoMIV family type II restriction endonuclease n=1 Tax=Sphingomonas crusticola TaxID=1697973 RepID=UPI000E27B755|nr:NgoMIV family type II restriction endonuclease [Sphingomonas crusticola]
MGLITNARAEFHASLRQKLFVLDEGGKPSNADKKQPNSTAIARHLAQTLAVKEGPALSPQAAGGEFEALTTLYLQKTFLELGALRPGDWEVHHVKSRSGVSIAQYEQYSHLGLIEKAAEDRPEIRALLGLNYNIASDVVISRRPEADSAINAAMALVDSVTANRASLRASSHSKPSLHACISCKWTMRSDRAQNARSEALNLIRSRRGRVPHIVVLTAEPTPSRLASLALGTGDIDCVYHIALPELEAAVENIAHHKQRDLLKLMIEQQRLKDVADLPLDLAI